MRHTGRQGHPATLPPAGTLDIPRSVALRAYTTSGVGAVARVYGELSRALESLGVANETNAKIAVHIGDPRSWRPDAGRYNVAIAWWPFSRISEFAYVPLYGVDVLLVPSPWCASGVRLPKPHQRLAIVPFGVDGGDFQPSLRERGDMLRFLFFDTRASSYEAGADIAVAAFRDAFPGRKDVALDVWTSEPVDDVYTDDPRIQLRRCVGTSPASVFARYDALLCTARGSGFGFMPIEAAATGLPVIHSGEGAFEAIADIGLIADSRRIAVRASIQRDAECFEPQVESAIRCMQRIDADYAAAQERAQVDARTIRGRFTWEKTATRLLKVLEGRDALGESRDVPERQLVPS